MPCSLWAWLLLIPKSCAQDSVELLQTWQQELVAWGNEAKKTARRDPSPLTLSRECPAPLNLPMPWPERCCTRCPEKPQLFSIDPQEGFKKTMVRLVNELMDQDAEVRSVDYDNNEELLDVMVPGQVLEIPCVEGQVYRVYGKTDGKLLLEHMAGRRVLTGDIDMAKVLEHLQENQTEQTKQIHETEKTPDEHFRDNKTKHNATRGEGWYRRYGFTNTLPVVLQLFFLNKQGEEIKLVELEPGGVHFETTYPTHKFIARTRDGQLATELLVADVGIRDYDCTDEQGLKLLGLGDRIKAH